MNGGRESAQGSGERVDPCSNDDHIAITRFDTLFYKVEVNFATRPRESPETIPSH
jgi:hypothetical protein